MQAGDSPSLGRERVPAVGADGSDFWECVKTAKPQDPEELRQASDFIDRVKAMFYPAHGDERDPVLRLDRDVEWFEFRTGELTVWTGYNGHGKSLMLSQILLGLMQQGERVVVFSGEMTPERQLKRVAKRPPAFDRPTMGYLDAIGRWLHDKMWLFNVVGSASIERLLTVFLYASKRYGTRHFVIDSLMMTDVPEDGAGAMTAQKEAVRKLCDFAKRNNCHIHLSPTHAKGSMSPRGRASWTLRGVPRSPMALTTCSRLERPPGRIKRSRSRRTRRAPELQKQRNGDMQHTA